jgi:hypothetical protein
MEITTTPADSSVYHETQAEYADRGKRGRNLAAIPRSRGRKSESSSCFQERLSFLLGGGATPVSVLWWLVFSVESVFVPERNGTPK